jgi:hypothetical protein
MTIGMVETGLVPDYAWRTDSDGTLSVYEKGVSVGSFGTYATTDALSVVFENGTVTYYKSGVAKRAVVRAIGNPLYGLYTPFATLTGGVLTSITGVGITYNSALSPAALFVVNSTSVIRVTISGGGKSTITNAFSGITGITSLTTGAGDMYVCTSGGNISKVAVTGTVTSLTSSLTTPVSITTDGSTYLYVVDGTTIRRVDLSGAITQIATSLTSPSGIALYGLYLYVVTDGTTITRVLISTGEKTTLISGFTGLTGITSDGSGGLYVTAAASVYYVNISTAIKTLVTTAGLNAPTGVAFNGTNVVYALDSGYLVTGTLGNTGVANVSFDNSARLSNGQWQHIIVTYSGDVNRARLYINGNLESTVVAPSYTSTSSPLQFGTSWSGYIDDVYAYSSELVPSECTKLYAYEYSLLGESLVISSPGRVLITSL